MNAKSVGDFYNLCKTDERIGKEIINAVKDYDKEKTENNLKKILNNIILIAKQNGYDLKESSILEYVKENSNSLSMEDLKSVSGGASKTLSAMVAAATFFSSVVPNQQVFASEQDYCITPVFWQEDQEDQEYTEVKVCLLGLGYRFSEEGDELDEMIGRFLSDREDTGDLSNDLRSYILSHSDILLEIWSKEAINRGVFLKNLMNSEPFLDIFFCTFFENDENFKELKEQAPDLLENAVRIAFESGSESFIDAVSRNEKIFNKVNEGNKYITRKFIESVNIEFILQYPEVFKQMESNAQQQVARTIIEGIASGEININFEDKEMTQRLLLNIPDLLEVLTSLDPDIIDRICDSHPEEFMKWIVDNRVFRNLFRLNPEKLAQCAPMWINQEEGEEDITINKNFINLIMNNLDLCEDGNLHEFLNILLFQNNEDVESAFYHSLDDSKCGTLLERFPDLINKFEQYYDGNMIYNIIKNANANTMKNVICVRPDVIIYLLDNFPKKADAALKALNGEGELLNWMIENEIFMEIKERNEDIATWIYDVFRDDEEALKKLEG